MSTHARTWITGRRALALALALAIAMLAFRTLPTAAQDSPPPIGVRELTTRSAFTDDVNVAVRVKPAGRSTQVLHVRGGNVAMAEITVQPGAAFPWHTHPGPVFATVKQGALVYVYADDCQKRRYPAGTTFIDPGYGNIHTAYNPTGEPTVVVATFMDAPRTGPLTIPVAPGDQPYDDCRVQVGTHAH